MKLFISTDHFSKTSKEPEKIIRYNELTVRYNQHNRRITTAELAEEIGDAEVLVAGTEVIDESVFRNANKLKLIARVGIGLDGIDFESAKRYGVTITHTPDAPSRAVAELTLGVMLDLARGISLSSNNLKKENIWRRNLGSVLQGKRVGIIGMGRIGKTVIHLLSSFNVRFLVHELEPDVAFSNLYNVELVSKTDVLKFSDFVSLHIPLNDSTKNYISEYDLSLMKPSSFIINTARGGVVNEADLYRALHENQIAGAAVDVFEQEPYTGPLKNVDNCILTCHMGASTQESRSLMEIQALEEVVRYKNKETLKYRVN